MKKSLRLYPLFMILGLGLACGGENGAPAEEAQEPAAAAPEEAAVAAQSMDLPDGVTAEMVSQGETVFTGTGICYTCHMPGGVGGPLAPNLTDDEWINIDGSYDAIINLVMTGVPEPVQHPGLMLPKGGTNISDDDVRAVAAYVWTLSRGD
ncbi:c-type cytochrome [Gemmatimonadota bacterium]